MYVFSSRLDKFSQFNNEFNGVIDDKCVARHLLQLNTSFLNKTFI